MVFLWFSYGSSIYTTVVQLARSTWKELVRMEGVARHATASNHPNLGTAVTKMATTLRNMYMDHRTGYRLDI